MKQTRGSAYSLARILGDVIALLSLNPARIGKRYLNKWLGKNVHRRLWFK